MVTGKPVSIGGTLGRQGATGKGVTTVTAEILAQLGQSVQDARVVIQGIGNVGSYSARYLSEMGARVIAMSDSRSGLYNANGLDIEGVTDYKRQNGTLEDCPLGETISNEDLLALSCDVMVPAALEGQITGQNASRVQAKVIIEGANGPTTPDADDVLQDKGVTVVPDILANAGGVVVSYFEWAQNLQAYFWDASHS